MHSRTSQLNYMGGAGSPPPPTKEDFITNTQNLENFLYNSVTDQLCKGIPPGHFLPLGRVKGAKKLLCRARKIIGAHRDWQRDGNGFLFQGNIRLPFCVVWGPIFAVHADGHLVTRLRIALLQYDADDHVEAFAVDVVNVSAQLARWLYLDQQEASALTAMAKVGLELFSNNEYLLEIMPADMVPTRSQAKRFSILHDERKFLDVLPSLGQSGRELVLTGILNQLSPFLPSKYRPCLLVNLVGCGRELSAVRSILGAVNFSSYLSGEGTAPPIIPPSGNAFPSGNANLSLYQAVGQKIPFLTALELAERHRGHSSTAVCPFSSVPILLTDSHCLRGYVWNIEFREPLPGLTDTQFDRLRAAASLILRKPRPLLKRILSTVAAAEHRPDAYRTTEVMRWRQTIVSAILPALFPSAHLLDQAMALFLSDAERAAQQAELHKAQLQKALRLLDDPATYGDGGIVPIPQSCVEADKHLKSAFAFYYQPSSSRTNRTGPFLCFTDESLLRLLQQNSIPGTLLEEIINALRASGRLKDRTETIQFKSGKSCRYIKLDVGQISGLLTPSQTSR